MKTEIGLKLLGEGPPSKEYTNSIDVIEKQ